jgi:hypothetical protein
VLAQALRYPVPRGRPHQGINALSTSPSTTIQHRQEILMNIKALFAAASLLATVACAHAQQTEFTAPDAGFRARLTRAEVRQELVRAQGQGLTVQRQHDGQDPAYAGMEKSRDEVKAEQESAARPHGRESLVDSLYFG